MKVCSLHFKNDDFVFGGAHINKIKRLKKTAVPSLNLSVRSHDCILSPTQMQKHLDREQRLQNRDKKKSVQKAVEHVEGLPDLTAGEKSYDTMEAARNLLYFKESPTVFSRNPLEIKKTYEDKGVQVNTYCIEKLMDSDYKCRILTGVINLAVFQVLVATIAK
ncbi:hypothetical protein ILUMI_14941, partial [Ignelater luminosus]